MPRQIYQLERDLRAAKNADNTADNETSHDDVVVDGDFPAEGLMKTDGVGGYSVIDDNSSTWDVAADHSTSNGSDHSFIDQSVVSGAIPTFTGTNITGVPAANILPGTFGTGDYIVDGLLRTENAIHILEITTPAAITNYGAIYTKSNNQLYFQDGAGAEHVIHGDSFSNIWYHGASTSVTIASQDAFIKIDIIENVGKEDDTGNAVGSSANNEITISTDSGGVYDINFHASITSAGANREMLICPGIEFVSPRVITDVTDNAVSPIVVTIVGHQFRNGDMVEISNVGGNTNANGSFMAANKTADTFELVALDGAATTGNANYTSGGTVDICFPGNMVMHRTVSQTQIGMGGGGADQTLSAGDKVAMYVANLDAASDLNIFMISLEIKKIGD